MTKIHQEDIAVLPLFPWEERAIQDLRKGITTCQPPNGVHETCCPGSISMRGEVTVAYRDWCKDADYEQMHHAAHEFVKHWPPATIIINNSSNNNNNNTTPACDVCRIIDILRIRKEPLVVMGDSLTMQTFDGFHCELERRGYIVNMTETKRLLWLRGWGNIKTNTTLEVRSPHWSSKEFVIVHLFFVYSVPLTMVQGEVEEINQVGGILWFNFGLHDSGKKRVLTKLESNMKSFFATLKANSTFSLIVFRETTAQHFDTPSGLSHFLPHRSEFCTPLEWNGEVGLRDQAVRNAAMAVGYELVSPSESCFDDKNKMVVLPFHNYTAELHAGHPIDRGIYKNITKGECTHFCSTPLLWVPLWRTLRIALDAAFSSH